MLPPHVIEAMLDKMHFAKGATEADKANIMQRYHLDLAVLLETQNADEKLVPEFYEIAQRYDLVRNNNFNRATRSLVLSTTPALRKKGLQQLKDVSVESPKRRVVL